MGADPFQIDTENLCPHLQAMLKIKSVASDAVEIIEKEFPASKPFPVPQIPKDLRFDA
jgi:hypothetical protein